MRNQLMIGSLPSAIEVSVFVFALSGCYRVSRGDSETDASASSGSVGSSAGTWDEPVPGSTGGLTGQDGSGSVGGSSDTSVVASTGVDPADGKRCGNGVVESGEECDDGINRGAYGECNRDCTRAPFCGDGRVDVGNEACDDSNLDSSDGCLADCTAPLGCPEIKAFDDAAASGAYIIDPDGADGLSGSIQVYCNMDLDQGGWQLISARAGNSGALFADYICSDIAGDCSGTIRPEQVRSEESPDLLLATNDGAYWVRLTGLAPPGTDALMDVISLDRMLTASSICTGEHYCDQNLEPLVVADSSDNYVPRFTVLSSQFVRLGGFWLGNGGGSAGDHVLSLNYDTHCSSGGLFLSDESDNSLGNVVCGVPGAIYFRY